MNQALKQRLAGILVLGCLAVIFIPLLLDGEGVAPPAIDTRMPAPPALDYEEVPQPQRPLIDADGLAIDSTASDITESVDSTESTGAPLASGAPDLPDRQLPVATDRSSADADPAASTPRRDAAGLPEGWTVRVGVYSNSRNADTLRACLITEGFPAYARPLGSDLTGIFVGPDPTRAEATATGGRLRDKCGLAEEVMIMQYTHQ